MQRDIIKSDCYFYWAFYTASSSCLRLLSSYLYLFLNLIFSSEMMSFFAFSLIKSFRARFLTSWGGSFTKSVIDLIVQ